MTKIDIVSGFLGAGKTTLIKKLLSEVFAGTKVVLIENEFGEIGIDGGFLKESGIEIREMNAGCICCSLVGDFGTSLKEVMETNARSISRISASFSTIRSPMPGRSSFPGRTRSARKRSMSVSNSCGPSTRMRPSLRLPFPSSMER